MPELQTFLREAWAATERQKAMEAAAAERRKAMEAAAVERQKAMAAAAAAEAQRLRRNAASAENALGGVFLGAVIGGIVLGFSGCVSCAAHMDPSRSQMISDFNLFNGLLYGAIVGAVIGIIVGIIIGQTKD